MSSLCLYGLFIESTVNDAETVNFDLFIIFYPRFAYEQIIRLT